MYEGLEVSLSNKRKTVPYKRIQTLSVGFCESGPFYLQYEIIRNCIEMFTTFQNII